MPEEKIKIEGIKSKKEFREILNKGQKISSKFFLTYVKKTPETDSLKLGFIITKKIGNAVLRNKIKRRIREALRTVGSNAGPGASFVFIARKAAAEASYLNIIEVLNKVLKKVQKIKD